MRFRKILTAAAPMFAAMIISLLMASSARADRFSAIMVFDDDGFETESKVYVHDGNYRIEPGLSYEPILIARKDDNVMYRIDQDTGEYTEDIFRVSDLPLLLANPKPKSMTSFGDDECEGRLCMKYETVVLDMGGKEHKEFRWFEKFVSRPIKFQAEDESWTYYLKDIVVGSQDPALFEPPAEDEGGDEYGDEYEDEYGDEYEDGAE
jgi:hypothetical protein